MKRVFGHAGPPGSGPHGETCGSCEFLRRYEMGSAWFKCGHAYGTRTNSAASDIRKKDLACRYWAKREA